MSLARANNSRHGIAMWFAIGVFVITVITILLPLTIDYDNVNHQRIALIAGRSIWIGNDMRSSRADRMIVTYMSPLATSGDLEGARKDLSEMFSRHGVETISAGPRCDRVQRLEPLCDPVTVEVTIIDDRVGWPFRGLIASQIVSHQVGIPDVPKHICVGGIPLTRSMGKTSASAFPILALEPIWSGILLNALLGGVAGIVMLRIWRHLIRRIRLRRGLCPHCGYPAANYISRCPECGQETVLAGISSASPGV